MRKEVWFEACAAFNYVKGEGGGGGCGLAQSVFPKS